MLTQARNAWQMIWIQELCHRNYMILGPFPLHTITTAKEISALVQLFSRVGIPDKIIRNQGTDFTSWLMKLLNHQLRIAPIKISPYYLQTDGLIERFKQTLKNLLRTFQRHQ